MLETPCFILDESELRRSIDGFQSALNKRFKRAVLGYSVKTNSVPRCMSIAKERGAYAEVVSFDEYQLAKLCGFEGDKIVYNGPLKDKETFLEAVMNGAIVNIETKREIEWLKELPNNKEFKVGIRLNCNISSLSPKDADGDNDNSRFGFSDETDEFKQAIDEINSLPNIYLAGLHLHRTAHSRSVRFYKKLIERACEVIAMYRLVLDYLDVGGGYFGIFPNKPTYQEYADAFHEVLKAHGMEDLTVIVEPGNALVASCFKFLSEVIDVKHVENDCYFVTTDGSRNDIDPFFRKSAYMYELMKKSSGKKVKRQIIGGCTCLEYDRLFEMGNTSLLEIGDRILYKNVGAYTMCLTPLFIRYIPQIYAETENGYKLIRKRWTANDYIRKSII